MLHQRGASELGEAEGSSPRRPCFLEGALPRFGILPAFSDCPALGKKNSHSCLERVEWELVLLQLHNADISVVALGAAGQLGAVSPR